MNPVVIAVAITGSVPRKKDNPAVPILPPEQVESTLEAYEAGATLVHIHVRNDDETSSSDPERFRQVQEGVNRLCPGMIVQFSTGGRGRDPSLRSSAPNTRAGVEMFARGLGLPVAGPPGSDQLAPYLIEELLPGSQVPFGDARLTVELVVAGNAAGSWAARAGRIRVRA